MNRVLAITATYRRPAGLAHLLASLATERPLLAGVVVVDNAGLPETREIAARAPLPVRVVAPGCNLGCGGGVALGLQETWKDANATHAWIFDDDAAATPGALAGLLAALERAEADVAVPVVTDAAGHIGWFPGPLAQPAWDVIRCPQLTPDAFRAVCGDAPLRWNWAPWPSLLVTRRAAEEVGPPRPDYWFQGEDLEWTLRLSARFTGVLAPAAECRHLPPPQHSAAHSFLKQALMLQNNFYTGTHLPHGRRLLRHTPGNVGRFLKANRFSARSFAAAWLAGWRGACRGRPAGAPGGDGLRTAWQRLTPSR